MLKVQSSKFKVQSNKSAEQISQKVFRLMIGLAVLVFGLFYLIGYDLPFDENPDFNAPLFTDVLIFLMWLFLIGGVGLAVYSMVKDYRSSKSEAVVNGVPVRRIFVSPGLPCWQFWFLPSSWEVPIRCSSMARTTPTGCG